MQKDDKDYILTDEYFDTPHNEEIVIDLDKLIDKLKSEHITKFEEIKFRKGWKLKIMRINELMMNFTLYNNADTFIESKMFNLRNDDDIDKMKTYIELFDDDPEKNLGEIEKIDSEEPLNQPNFDDIKRTYNHNY